MSAQPRPPAPGWGDAGLVSGEAVALDVRVARIGSRALALLLDVLTQLLLALALAMLVGIVLAALPMRVVDAALSNAFGTVALVAVLVGYPVLFERFNHGRTPGKMAVGLRVVSADGAPVGVRQSLTRALVGVAVEWPGLVLPLLSWVAGVTVMLTDRHGRRLGDLVAGTMVVHTRSATIWRPVPTSVPALVGWAYTLDLSRLDDGLALAARQYLARVHQLAEPARDRLARGLWAEMAAVITPPPPPGLPATVYLAAVLGERHRRARLRLARGRAVTAALWPELLPGPATPPAASAASSAIASSAASAAAPATAGDGATPSVAAPTVAVRPAAPGAGSVAVPAQAGPPALRPATAPGDRPDR
ncbi:RDD family protein [Micromonospora echinaurantiaca]|uniref:RDD family protein n=1 Tax=Micromonospora echinaurantiaca TaxID=47857 RepID=UPI0037A57824